MVILPGFFHLESYFYDSLSCCVILACLSYLLKHFLFLFFPFTPECGRGRRGKEGEAAEEDSQNAADT